MSKRLVKPKPARVEREPVNWNPTTTQLEALAAHERLRLKLGRHPSVREVSEALGLTTAGAQPLLAALTIKGLLEEVKELRVVGRQLTPLGKKWLEANKG